MNGLTVLLILLLIGGFIFIWMGHNMDELSVFPYIISSVLFATVGAIIYEITLYNKPADKPQAIDVYNNKTTLEITFKDSIPVDTIVVFKEKQK